MARSSFANYSNNTLLPFVILIAYACSLSGSCSRVIAR